MTREITQEVMHANETPIRIRFQLATNGVVCITDAGDRPVILTSAGKFRR